MIRALLVLPALASCSGLVPAPDLPLDGVDPEAAWASHLDRHVDEGGRIDFAGMETERADLDRFVAWIAEPRADDREGAAELAYLINAYNALAMYGVLDSGRLPREKIRFFYLCEFQEGGRRISLYDLENDVIRALGEPRIHFALNCMVRSCPRLPRVPFQAAILDGQLEAAAREFFNDPRHVQLVPDDETVLFSKILDWYEEDFLGAAPSLIAYANRYRDEPIPESWRVRFLDYDWSLNETESAP
ncbi:MAG: DUF547 domain-containing protein [Planctomycetota bacterium]